MGTGVVVFLAVVIFLLPLLAGYAIGRRWALALVVWLVLATSVADGLEPLQREPPSEVEGSFTLTALVTGYSTSRCCWRASGCASSSGLGRPPNRGA